MMALAIFPVGLRAQATFAGQSKMSTFSFDWRKGMIFLPVRVNGSKQLSFVLDTGSTRNLIDRSLATALGLEASRTGSLQVAGAGRIPIAFIHDVRLGFPGLETTGYQFSTADLKPLEASLGVRVDGILGYEIFSRFVVDRGLPGKTSDVHSSGSLSRAGQFRTGIADRSAR